MMSKIVDLIHHSPSGVEGNIVDNHVILDIVGKDVHFWSPQLNFRIEQSEDNKDHCVISGLVGPRPEVWTMFMFIYFSLGISGFFVGAYGASKMVLGEFSNLVLAFPLAFIFMLTAYGTGKYGEKLAHDQIEILKQFVRDAIEDNTTVV